MTDDRDARIRARAHQIWEAEGQPDNKAEEHWQRAMDEIAAEDAAAAPKTRKKAAPRKPAAPRATSTTRKAKTA